MKEKILQLRKEGKTYTEIQKQLKCSKSTISYHCGKGQKEKMKSRLTFHRRKQRDWVDEYKKQARCSNCGEGRYWVLVFHHRDPSKKEGNINVILRTRGFDLLKKEIEKCDVLCANCHRDLHYRQTQV